MSKLPIVLLGGGGHGKVVLDLLLRLPGYEVLGYLDPKDRGNLLGYPWLGDESKLSAFLREHSGLCGAIGLGKVDSSSKRRLAFEKWRQTGLVFPALVAPGAYVSAAAKIFEGAVVMEGAIVQPGAQVGAGAIVNTRAAVDHDCWIGENVHLAPGSVLSGEVQVGRDSMIGVGAVVREGVRITEGCLVGAGAVVVDRELCNKPGVYLGTPARRREA